MNLYELVAIIAMLVGVGVSNAEHDDWFFVIGLLPFATLIVINIYQSLNKKDVDKSS